MDQPQLPIKITQNQIKKQKGTIFITGFLCILSALMLAGIAIFLLQTHTTLPTKTEGFILLGSFTIHILIFLSYIYSLSVRAKESFSHFNKVNLEHYDSKYLFPFRTQKGEVQKINYSDVTGIIKYTDDLLEICDSNNVVRVYSPDIKDNYPKILNLIKEAGGFYSIVDFIKGEYSTSKEVPSEYFFPPIEESSTWIIKSESIIEWTIHKNNDTSEPVASIKFPGSMTRYDFEMYDHEGNIILKIDSFNALSIIPKPLVYQLKIGFILPVKNPNNTTIALSVSESSMNINEMGEIHSGNDIIKYSVAGIFKKEGTVKVNDKWEINVNSKISGLKPKYIFTSKSRPIPFLLIAILAMTYTGSKELFKRHNWDTNND